MKKIVQVTWWDAQDHPDKWADEANVEEWGQKACQIVSIGFLVSKTDKYVTLAADWDDDDKDYGRVTKIPFKMVVKIVYLVEEDGSGSSIS